MSDLDCTQEDRLVRIEGKLDKVLEGLVTHKTILSVAKGGIISIIPLLCVYLGYYLSRK